MALSPWQVWVGLNRDACRVCDVEIVFLSQGSILPLQAELPWRAVVAPRRALSGQTGALQAASTKTLTFVHSP